MKIKRDVVVLVIVFVLFLMLVNVYGDNNSGKIKSNVYNAIQNGNAHVYIRYNGDSNKLIDNIGVKNIKYNSGKVIAAVLDQNQIDVISQDPNVQEIGLVPVKHIFLQQSIPIINANQSWQLQQNTLNITGKYQTICIIDTGINYTHSDLGGCSTSNFLSGNCSKVVGGWDFVNNVSNPMDDNGHGTHVAGIAAANGGLRGVAPDANIVSIKVCDSSGSCSDDAVRNGIDWCVHNASLYNISVISISLGGSNYSSYCDYLDDPLNITLAINNATAYNISVVVASGNQGLGNNISSPGCVQNATAVGSTNKSDSISSFSNRYYLMSLFAPGGTVGGSGSCDVSTTDPNRICSTWFNGYYLAESGTSMATPHVAGAEALIKEYLNLTGRKMTPKQIESVLNATGLRMNDTAGNSSNNYSRINIYNALISLDNFSPNVTLITPSNGANTILVNQTFSCNATDLALKNVTFFLWNSTGVYNSSSSTISGGNYTFSINIKNIRYNSYSWNCLFANQNNNSAYAISNSSLVFDNLTITLNSPSNNTLTKSNQTFNCSAISNSSLSNVTFFLWNSNGSIENSSFINISGQTNTSSFGYNFTHSGNYSWNCLFVNGVESLSYPTNNTINYDSTPPILTILSPSNNSWYKQGLFNVTINEPGNCLYSINNGINITLSSTDNMTFSASNTSLAATNYSLYYYCNDSLGNMNTTQLQFNIDFIAPSVTLLSPIDVATFSGSQLISFQFNVTHPNNLAISRCDLFIDDSNRNHIDSPSYGKNNLSYTPAVGDHTWNVNCTDEAGNSNLTTEFSFTINSTSSTTTTTSTSTSTTTTTNRNTTTNTTRTTASVGNSHYATEVQLIDGYNILLNKSDVINFAAYNKSNSNDTAIEGHSLTLDYVNATAANITVTSTPIKFVLGIGESKKLNLSVNYYNFEIKLINITNGLANITIDEINEPISSGAGNNGFSLGFGDFFNKTWVRITLLVLIIVVIVGVVLYIIYLKLGKMNAFLTRKPTSGELPPLKAKIVKKVSNKKIKVNKREKS